MLPGALRRRTRGLHDRLQHRQPQEPHGGLTHQPPRGPARHDADGLRGLPHDQGIDGTEREGWRRIFLDQNQ